MRLAMLLVVVVVLAMGGGEVALFAQDAGYAMQANDARLTAAYGVGMGE